MQRLTSILLVICLFIHHHLHLNLFLLKNIRAYFIYLQLQMVTKMTQHVFDIGEKKIYFRVKQEGRKGQPVVI